MSSSTLPTPAGVQLLGEVTPAFAEILTPDALAFVAGDFSYEPYGIVVPRDDPDFKLAVNRALVSLYRTGDIDQIFQHWLGALGQPGTLLHAMFYLNTLPE